MDKLKAGFLFGIFLFAFVGAYQISGEDLEKLKDANPSLVEKYLSENAISNPLLCEVLKGTYGSEIIGQQVPDRVPFKNEVINVYIGGEIFGHAILKEGYVESLNCSVNEKSSYDVKIKDYGVVEDFQNSKDYIETMQEKLKSGEIEIEGHGFIKKVKLKVAKIGLNFLRKFM